MVFFTFAATINLPCETKKEMQRLKRVIGGSGLIGLKSGLSLPKMLATLTTQYAKDNFG